MSESYIRSLKSKAFAYSFSKQTLPSINLQLFMIVFAASLFFSLCDVKAQQDKPYAKDDETIIVNTDLISFTVSVTDSYGHHIVGLKKDAFTVFDNNTKQEIEFFSDEDAPASVGFIFDYSGSMFAKLQMAKQALSRFMDNGHKDDEYFLIAFNEGAQLLRNWTGNHQEILDSLVYANARGSTAMYDACYLGISKLIRSGNKKKVILLISDGMDNNSRYNFKELKELLKESDISVYSIAIQSEDDRESVKGYEAWVDLRNLSKISGGRAFIPEDVSQFDEIFDYIALDIRRTYSIGYRPTYFQADGKWRKIKVKVAKIENMPNVSVRTREGYYSGRTW